MRFYFSRVRRLLSLLIQPYITVTKETSLPHSWFWFKKTGVVFCLLRILDILIPQLCKITSTNVFQQWPHLFMKPPDVRKPPALLLLLLLLSRVLSNTESWSSATLVTAHPARCSSCLLLHCLAAASFSSPSHLVKVQQSETLKTRRTCRRLNRRPNKPFLRNCWCWGV